ncbi:dihydropteroate synthase [Luminiphilus syltensis NOR5-1B]|uniref:Dihydropteroate synthase n=1 Tax=Luminiphilus syltensis NOR5-1B TaxID=565045 RepID=B8KS06_9GAMM|nr:dihydropteroate synthase [Luminiphilus syltensis NOR5-1B]
MFCGDKPLDLSTPQLMGVLNITPDSFSDGGQLYRDGELRADVLCRRAEAMVDAGVAVLDIGGESTRPGATAVSEQEELDRVLAALAVIESRFDAIISLDTSSPRVITEGAAAGAAVINDVRALRRPGALEAAAAAGLPVCLMHMRGEPGDMQDQPHYDSVVDEVSTFFAERIKAVELAGIPRSRVLLDPGFGFGKTPEHNFTLLRRLGEFLVLGCPLAVGLSRKSMIASVIDRTMDQRVSASIALALMAAERGARLLRVHDVRESSDALAMLTAMEQVGL